MSNESEELIQGFLASMESRQTVEGCLNEFPFRTMTNPSGYTDIVKKPKLEYILKDTLKEFVDLKYALNQFSVYTVTDINGVIIDVNPRFTEMSQYSREELIGQTHRIVNSGIHPKSLFDDLWSTILKGDTWRGELCNRAKDGSLYWVDCFIVPLLDGAGNPYRFMAFRTDITEKVQLRERLNEELYYDRLTGLANRALLENMLQLEIENYSAKDNPLAVIFLDVRRLKYINDLLGYSIGDKLLCAIAGRLNRYVGEKGIVSRFGGDEFVILKKVASTSRAVAFGNELSNLFERPFELDNLYEFQINVSIGISFYPNDATRSDDLIRAANTALNRAKEDLKRQIHLYSPSVNVDSLKLFSLANDIPRALRNGEFRLYFQPQLDLESGLLTGAEALLRWEHPDWGQIFPSEFIPIAENTGLIVEVTEWVLRSAAREWVSWKKAGLSPIRIAVNFSAHDLTRKNLGLVVKKILVDTNMDPMWLDVEITETMIIESEQRVYRTLDELRGLGIKIALDDFGTGYSSLNHLRNLPADILKIDKSFIDQCDNGVTCAKIIEGIIQLAHALELKVIAEGVESESQLQFLQTRFCDAAQGYLLSRPLSAKQFRTLIEQNGALNEKYWWMNRTESQNPREFTLNGKEYKRVRLKRGLKGILQIRKVRQKAINAGPTEVIIGSIGCDGLCLYSNIQLPVTPHVTFQIAFTLFDNPVIAMGSIIWGETLNDGVFQYGFRFLMNSGQRQELGRLLVKLRSALESAAGLDEKEFLEEESVKYFIHQTLRKTTGLKDSPNASDDESG